MKERKKHIINIALLIIYAILIYFGKLHHEVWRDEIHGPLISMHSHSLSELIDHIKYEGHPPLAYLLYQVGYFFNYTPIYLSILFYCFAIGMMALLLWLPKFNLFEKILLLTNYYLLYEFGVFNRIYIVFMFFLAWQWWCIIYKHEKSLFLATAIGICLYVQCIPLMIIGYFYYFVNNKISIKNYIFTNKHIVLIGI